MSVDEAGCDVEPLRVDDLLRRRRRQLADGDNAIAGDGHVGGDPRRAGAIEHAAAANQDVVLLRGRDERRQDENEKERNR